MTIQLKRDTAANWTSVNPVLANGQPAYDTTNNVLKIGNGVATWSALTAIGGGGVSDHGALTGLADDDHSQYHNNTRGDVRYYTKTLLDAGQLDTRYFTEAEVTAGFQPYDADLISLAAASATDSLYYRSAANTWSPVTIGANITFSGGTLSASGGGATFGTVDFDFGTGSGTNVVQTVVSSASIGAGSKVELFLMGTDSTATHNTIEHQLLPLGGLSLQVVSVSAGVGFTAQAASMLRLTGTFTARWSQS